MVCAAADKVRETKSMTASVRRIKVFIVADSIRNSVWRHNF